MTAEVRAETIDLAREPSFRLGPLDVRPASLEVANGDRRETLEPRVMQVLVALARSRGEVVSRDQLIQLCWGGRVVGDDAITRCLTVLRKLGKAHGAFEVETIRRVGFRLTEDARVVRPRRPWFARVGYLAALPLLVLSLAGGLAIWISRQESASEPRIALQAFQPLGKDAASLAFSTRLTDEVSGMLNANVLGVAPSVATAGPVPDGVMVIGGSASREGARLRVRAYLEDGEAKVTLWSRQFEATASDEADLRAQVGAAAAEIAIMALEPSKQKGLKLDARTMALYLNAFAALKNPQFYQEGAARRGFEEVVARAPQFAEGHGLYADSLVITGFPFPQQRPVDLQLARREALTAIRIEPRAGAAYDALFITTQLENPGDLAAAEDWLLRGLKAAPAFAYLSMRECQFLVNVGRTREGLRHCERAIAADALEPVIGWRNAGALYAHGETELAERSIREVVRLHPEHQNSRRKMFEIAAFSGSPETAAALLRSGAPVYVRGEGRNALELFLAARRSRDPRAAGLAVAALRKAARSGDVDPSYAVLGAATLDRVDDAFETLEEPWLPGWVRLAALVHPVAAPLRRDPRFWPLAAKAGYVRYWKTRGVWPDFCSEPDLPYDCRVEAARVSSPAG